MLTQRPAPRPYDVIALEVLLTLASALQAGLLLWLGLATWDERGLTGTPVAGVLVVLAIALGIGWFLWLIGRGGWLLAATMAITGVEAGFLWVLGLSGGASGVSGTTLLFMVIVAIFGAICGAFLPAPSSRRYRPEPRVRPDAGAAAPPKVTPSVARAADKYAKPAVVAASAVASAGAQKVSRGGSTASGPASTSPTGSEPVLQPRPGTPIRTSGPVTADEATPAAGATATPARGATATTPPAPAAQRSPAPLAPPSSSRPDAAAPAAKGSPTPLSPASDPGAIARSGRASIDAQLTPPPPAPKPSGTPGFRLVEPARSSSLPPAGSPDLRYNPSGPGGAPGAAPRSAGATDPRTPPPPLPPVANPVPRPGGMAPPAEAAGRAPLAPGDEPINGLPILGDAGEPPR